MLSVILHAYDIRCAPGWDPSIGGFGGGLEDSFHRGYDRPRIQIAGLRFHRVEHRSSSSYNFHGAKVPLIWCLVGATGKHRKRDPRAADGGRQGAVRGSALSIRGATEIKTYSRARNFDDDLETDWIVIDSVIVHMAGGTIRTI